jgi:hypothetical protein
LKLALFGPFQLSLSLKPLVNEGIHQHITTRYHNTINSKKENIYSITGNFCDVKFLQFWSKKMTFNFCGFFSPADWKSWHRKKDCLYYRKQQLKRCCDKQLVHITVILRSKNIFSSLESFQTLQLLNMHLINFKFVLRNYFFTVFAIYFVDRKYGVNSWIDIAINFDIFRMYIFNVEFSYFII